MKLNEYMQEDGEDVKMHRLYAPALPKEEYALVHKNIVIACHDAAIEYDGGILLVVRDNLPAKGCLWPIGGRINRGMTTTASLQKKVKEECGLEITNIVFLGTARAYFRTDPFDHGQGTDTLGLMFYGKGKGELLLDPLHKDPRIVTPRQYNPAFRASLHPYVREILDKAMPLVEKSLIEKSGS